MEARGAPPRTPSFRGRSLQSQLARACAAGLLTGFHARTPRAHGKRATGPGHLPQGQAVARGRVPDPGHPSRKRWAPPPRGALVPPPQGAPPARKSVRCGVGDGSTSPLPPRPRQTGSGLRPPAPRRGRSGRETAHFWTPLTEAPGAPLLRAPFCRPHSAPSKLARACAVGLVTVPTATPPAPTEKGQRGPAACSNDGQLREGECPTADTPHRGTKRPP